MRLTHVFVVGFLMLVLLAPTEACAHSPYQTEEARLKLGDGRVLSVRAHWGDGYFGADPVMAVAVIEDGTPYGTLVAIGPVLERERIGVRCPRVENCVVDYFGIGLGPDRSFRLRPEALSRVTRAPAEWEWCIDNGGCPAEAKRAFEPIRPVLIALDVFSPAALLASAVKLAPALLSVLLIGAFSAGSFRSRVVRPLAGAVGGLLALVALVWTPYFYLVGPMTPAFVDLLLVVAAVITIASLGPTTPKKGSV